jgi:hypothetical protein
MSKEAKAPDDELERSAPVVAPDSDRTTPGTSTPRPDEIQIESGEPAKEKNAKEQERGKTSWGFRLRLFLALVLPVFLETLDYTVVATAQPHIAVCIYI